MRSREITHVYSHQLAAAARVKASQVRRDIMSLGIEGSPVRGYHCEELIASIREVLDNPEGERVALVGLGNLGRAIMTYFAGRRPKLRIVAAFDVDPAKVDRVYHGVRCHSDAELPAVIREQNIRVGIITVPATVAQEVADRLVAAGLRGILNLAPRPLSVPEGVYIESLDVTAALEKVAYFSRQEGAREETPLD
jgi:redox-sensing transcriptional repressor